MRASVFINDPGYIHDAPYYEVYLDGKLLKNCFTADEETGEAFVYVNKYDVRLTDTLEDIGFTRKLTGTVKIVYTRSSGHGKLDT